MRIGFWDPYLTALGGGEKYLLTMLEEALMLPGAQVALLSDEPPRPREWARLGVHVHDGALHHVPAGDEAVVTERSRELDVLVVTTHDVPPRSLAARSVAMIQFPSRHHRRSWQRALDAAGVRRAPAALASYDLFLCNSQFTRRHIVSRLGVDATVLPPPVDMPPSPVTLRGRDPMILSVGRFFRGWHAKRHDVLIDAFRTMQPAAGVELHLAGGLDRADPGSAAYLSELRAQADGLPVHFHVDVDRDDLEALYARASLYWHAAGFGQDGRRHPERMEHFGITTVEAMARGAVPLAYAGGGQEEIVDPDRTGVLWRTKGELVEASAALLADPARREVVAAAGARAAHAYARERFAARVRDEVLAPAG
jgi:glycosyltransferase involved in cell wall biosynthesis